jgi:hypothetical protein
MNDSLKPKQTKDEMEKQETAPVDSNGHNKSDWILKNAKKRSLSSKEVEDHDLPIVDSKTISARTNKSERILENARRRSNQGSQKKSDEQKEPDSPAIETAQTPLEEREEPQPPKQEPADTDMLADIRLALVEEETAKKERKQHGVIQQMVRLLKPSKTQSSVEPAPGESEAESAPMDSHLIEEVELETSEKSDIVSSEDVDKFFSELIETSNTNKVDEEVGIAPSEVIDIAPPPDAPIPVPDAVETHHAEINFIEKKVEENALRPQPVNKSFDDNFEVIREVALKDYSDEPVQPESIPPVSLKQQVKILNRGLRPFEKFIFFGVILLFFAGILFSAITLTKRFLPTEETPTPVQNVPYPIRVMLPGGWTFELRKGVVVNGKWNPTGAEWLEGTELCKWVAVPWSLQLEAVLRTLKQSDTIELTMSNSDLLSFNVQSIQKVPVDQIGKLEKTSNCLLLILANEDSESRWVVTAIP